MVLVAILSTSLVGLVNPLLLGVLLDEVIIGGDYDRLNLYVGLMIVLPIITGLIGVGQSYLNNVIGQNVMQDLRAALYSPLQSMPLRFFTETKTGEIQSRLANDVGGVQSVVTDTASSITSNMAIAISTIVASAPRTGTSCATRRYDFASAVILEISSQQKCFSSSRYSSPTWTKQASCASSIDGWTN